MLKLLLWSVLILGSNALAKESAFFGKGLDGKKVSLQGYVKNEPRLYSGNNGKYVNYSFELNAAAQSRFGDEYVLVTFNTVKWCKKVGEFKFKKGEKVEVTGVYSESKGKNSSGLIGSLAVNDVSYPESRDYPAVCDEP